MSVTLIRPATSKRMAETHQRWQREIDNAQEALETALKAQRIHNAAGVSLAHRIDLLQKRIEMRTANIATFRA